MDNYEDPLHIIKELTLMSNQFMNKVLDDNIPGTETLLHIILENDKIKVKRVGIQHLLENFYGHSSQLDILAEDENGRQFNIEVQRSDEGAIAKRARFYSGALDMHFLEKGKHYKLLPDTYVIFITERDVLKEGRPVYNIHRYIDESGNAFEDGSHIVYVNASCRDDTPLGRLMQDFACADYEKMHYKVLADRVKYFKTTKEGERDMQDIIEVYAEKIAEKRAAKVAAEVTAKVEKEAKQAERIEFAKEMLSDGESIDKIVKYSKLSIEEVRALAAQLSA